MRILKNKQLLLVVAESLLVQQIESQLRERGTRIIGPAKTALDAYMLIEAFRIDVAVVDTHLGHQTSYLVAEALQQCKIPYVFVTTEGDRRLPPQYTGRTVVDHTPIDVILNILIDITES
jgi:DNA-binding NarL/FixJ family response regulator